MKLALVAYFSCIAAIFNFTASVDTKEKVEDTPYHAKIEVDVEEVNPFTGKTLPTKKYTQTVPLPKRSSSQVDIELKDFLGNFSPEPVVVRDVHVDPPTGHSNVIRRRKNNEIKTIHAKNNGLNADISISLVDSKGNPQDYRKYKRNIATRAGYFVAATATSALLLPIGVALTPVLICCDCLETKEEEDSSHEVDCCYDDSLCNKVWEGCIMNPQRCLWSKVFAKKTNREVVVNVT